METRGLTGELVPLAVYQYDAVGQRGAVLGRRNALDHVNIRQPVFERSHQIGLGGVDLVV